MRKRNTLRGIVKALVALALCVIAASAWAQGAAKTVRVQLIGSFKMEVSVDPRTGATIQGFEAVKSEFERLNPGIKLEFIMMGWDNYEKKTIAMALADEADVFQVPGIATMAPQGVLEPLQALITRDKFNLGVYLDGQVDGWLAMGPTDKVPTIYGLPFIGDVRVITYDKKLFDDWGVPYLSKEPTIEEIIAAAKRMTGTNPKTGIENFGVAWTGKDSADTVMNLNEYFGGRWGTGMRFKDLSYEFDSPTMVKALETLRGLVAYAPKGVMTGGGSEKFATADNTVAIQLRTGAGTYSTAALLGLGDRYATALLFINKKENKGGMFAGSPFAIGSSSKVKEEAWKFLKFTSSDFFTRFMFENYRGESLPVVKSALTWPLITANKNWSIIVEALGRLWTPRYPYRAAAPRGFLTAAVESAMSGSATVNEALAKAQKEAVTWSSQQ